MKNIHSLLLFLAVLAVFGCTRQPCPATPERGYQGPRPKETAAPVPAPKEAAKSTDDQIIGEIEKNIAFLMKDWGTPGLAIAIVKDGKPFLVKGYGVTDVKTGKKVDKNTAFYLASVTKNFTATLVATSVERKELSFDDTVAKRLPGFKMADPYFTKHLTIRDALSHRTGLGFHTDDTFIGKIFRTNGTITLKNTLAHLRTLKPLFSFRQAYSYSNSLYFIMGEILKRATGKAYPALLAERVLNPLKMTRTHVGFDWIKPDANLAMPHDLDPEGKVGRIPLLRGDFGPGGSIFSTADDMSRYLLMHLAKGKGVVKNPKPLMEMQTPHIFTGPNMYGDPAWKAAGLGWEMFDLRGLKVLRYDGFLPGLLSAIFIVPSRNIGVAVMINRSVSLAHMITGLTAIDLLAGRPAAPYHQIFRGIFKPVPVRKERPEFAKDLKQYIGKYTTVQDRQTFHRTITVKDGKLYCDNYMSVFGPPSPMTRLFPMDTATFFSKNADLVVTFRAVKGKIEMVFNHGGKPVTFVRKK